MHARDTLTFIIPCFLLLISLFVIAGDLSNLLSMRFVKT